MNRSQLLLTTLLTLLSFRGVACFAGVQLDGPSTFNDTLAVDLTTNLTLVQDVCLAVDSDYNLSIEGSGVGNAFELEHSTDSSQKLNYTVYWKPAGQGSSYTQITTPSVAVGFTKTAEPDTVEVPPGCATEDEESHLKVIINSLSSWGKPQGDYVGDIDLIVEEQ